MFSFCLILPTSDVRLGRTLLLISCCCLDHVSYSTPVLVVFKLWWQLEKIEVIFCVCLWRRCEVCQDSPFKYRCPRCSVKSCSLPCVKQHKLISGCNGQRDKTAFVPLVDFTDLNLLSGWFDRFSPYLASIDTV